jgi:hypothetical protein
LEVPDGVIFPILAAHSAFVRQNAKKTWVVQKPAMFSDDELIEAAKQAYMEIAGVAGSHGRGYWIRAHSPLSNRTTQLGINSRNANER